MAAMAAAANYGRANRQILTVATRDAFGSAPTDSSCSTTCSTTSPSSSRASWTRNADCFAHTAKGRSGLCHPGTRLPCKRQGGRCSCPGRWARPPACWPAPRWWRIPRDVPRGGLHNEPPRPYLQDQRTRSARSGSRPGDRGGHTQIGVWPRRHAPGPGTATKPSPSANEPGWPDESPGSGSSGLSKAQDPAP